MSDPFSRPSIADYVNALQATKYPTDVAARPTGYTLLLYSSASDPSYASRGLSANVYANPETGKIIISYLGPVTSANDLAGVYVDPVLLAAAKAVNQRIAVNDETLTPEMQNVVRDFIGEVGNKAQAAGYSFTNSNVFVTGNSEGALFTQLSAKIFGFGGTTFGGVPIPGTTSNDAPLDSRLDNYYYALDPIGNLGTDRAIGPQGTGTQYHYGNDIMIGKISDSAFLADAARMALSPGNEDLSATLATAKLFFDVSVYHPFTSYAKTLGVNLNKPQTVSEVDLSVMPDAAIFLDKSGGAISGSISWDANNKPTLTLSYSRRRVRAGGWRRARGASTNMACIRKRFA
ncbi:MAG TPA: hypothetical protein VN844_19060 [Pyrinomonadaceae bacterium]|nr:hypothetical protein [Pyrinomonadaceae bacterium]